MIHPGPKAASRPRGRRHPSFGTCHSPSRRGSLSRTRGSPGDDGRAAAARANFEWTAVVRPAPSAWKAPNGKMRFIIIYSCGLFFPPHFFPNVGTERRFELSNANFSSCSQAVEYLSYDSLNLSAASARNDTMVNVSDATRT